MGVGSIWEISAPSTLFLCEPRTVLKIVYLRKLLRLQSKISYKRDKENSSFTRCLRLLKLLQIFIIIFKSA